MRADLTNSDIPAIHRALTTIVNRLNEMGGDRSPEHFSISITGEAVLFTIDGYSADFTIPATVTSS